MGFQIENFLRWNERIVVETQGESGGVSGDGAISEIIDVNLAPNRLLLSNVAGKIVASSLVTAAEAETLDGIDTSQTIQEQIDSKQNSLTLGNFTEATSTVLTITGGTGAIIGSGLSIQVKLASAIQSGYLSSSDWSTFNNKMSGSLAVGYVFIGDGTAQAVDTGSLGHIGATVAGGLALKSSIISNTHILSNAAITRTKLATGTPYRILANNISGEISENAALTPAFAIISDANGQLAVSTTPALKLTYISTATSDLQVQINTLIAGKATNALIQAPTATEDGYAITWDDGAQEWNLTDPVVQGIPVAGSTSQVLMKYSGLDYEAAWTSLLVSHISNLTASAADLNVMQGADAAGVTTDIISYLGGATPLTSSAQQQISSKLTNSLSPGAIYYGNGAGVATQLSPATDGWVLTLVSGFPQWQSVPGTGTVTSIDVSGGTTGLSFSGGPVTTSGTITMSGTLHADDGGTGYSVYVVGDILYADTTTTLAQLGIGADGEVLTLAGGVPTWAAATATVGDADYGNITVSSTGTVWTVDANINKAWTGTHSFLDNSWTLLDNGDNTKILAFQLSGITTGTTRTLTIPDLSGTIALIGGSGNGAALTKVDDTNVTLTLGGGPTTSLLTAASLTLGWSGQLAVTRGGTGLSSTSQGDILYADASNSLVALPKNASASRYLSNSGASNNPAWSQIDLTNGVAGVLPVANGGTGVSTGAWLLASGGILSGVNTITSNAKNQLIFDGTWTATAADDYHIRINPTITGQGATNPNTYRAFYLTPSFVAGDNSQTFTAMAVDAAFDDNAKTSITKQLLSLRTSGTSRFSVNSVGATTITSAGTGLTISATAASGIFTTSTGAFDAVIVVSAQKVLNLQTSSAGTGLLGSIITRIDTGLGGTIFGQTWNIVPNSITTAGTKLRTDFSVKPGDGGSVVTGGYFDYVVYSNTVAPLITTGFEWATITSAVSPAVKLRLEGSNLGFNGVTAFDTGVGVFALKNAATEPGASVADQIMIYAKDSSDGSANSTLALRLEQAVEAIGTFTASHKIKVWINGVEYWLQLDAV